MHPIKRKSITEKSILLVPLLLAFLWMGFLVLDTQSPSPNMKLAPSRLDALVNALFIFIIIYALVLVIVFIRMNKQLKAEKKK